MFSVEFQPEWRLVTIRFSGRVEAEEMRACYERLQTLLADVPAGFRMLSDLSELEMMSPACAPFIRQSMQLCNGKGIARIVRVIPDPTKDIGFNLMAVFHYDPSVRITFCETLEDAKKLLELGNGG